MQTIGQVIFGISPDYQLSLKIDKYNISKLCGFETYYSRTTNVIPKMIGSNITNIEKTSDIDLTDLWNKINENLDEHKEVFEYEKFEVLEKISMLSENCDIPEDIIEEVRDWVVNTEPTIKIIWLTSKI